MRNGTLAAFIMVFAIGIGACSDDDEDEDSNQYSATLTGAAERPNPVTTTATGNFSLVDNGATMTYTLNVNGITGPITGAHIHAVAFNLRTGQAAVDTTGPIVVDLAPNTSVTTGILAQGSITAANIRALATGQAAISVDSLRTLINAGRTYVNVHTQANPGGHIRGVITRR